MVSRHIFDVWTYKISTFYLLSFQSYESFNDLHWKFHNFESSTRDRKLKFCMSKHFEKMCLETKFQPFRLGNDKDIDCPSYDVLTRFEFPWLYKIWRRMQFLHFSLTRGNKFRIRTFHLVLLSFRAKSIQYEVGFFVPWNFKSGFNTKTAAQNFLSSFYFSWCGFYI